MTYNATQLEAMDASAISNCSPKHMESVIAELIETARALSSDARRYDYLLTCDYIAASKYLPNLDEAGWKAKLREKHDAAISAVRAAEGGKEGGE